MATVADPRDVDALERQLRRLVRRAQRPLLLLGVLLLVLVAGVIFLAFALLIEWRMRQLIAAVRAEPSSLRSFRLHTRRAGVLGIDAVTSCFGYIGFRSTGGSDATLRLQGRFADLEALLRAMQRVAPRLVVEVPETVRVDVS